MEGLNYSERSIDRTVARTTLYYNSKVLTASLPTLCHKKAQRSAAAATSTTDKNISQVSKYSPQTALSLTTRWFPLQDALGKLFTGRRKTRGGRGEKETVGERFRQNDEREEERNKRKKMRIRGQSEREEKEEVEERESEHSAV